MSRIASDNLPMPANYAWREAMPIARTSSSVPSILQTRLRDATQERPPGFVLMTWQLVGAAVVDAVMAHYRETYKPFAWRAPKENTTVFIQWAKAPSVSWLSPTHANVVGEFEVSLAHE